MPLTDAQRRKILGPGGQLEKARDENKVTNRHKQLRNTVGKLFRNFNSNVNQKDIDIIAEFEADPRSYLDTDPHLAVDLKHLYDKRKRQV